MKKFVWTMLMAVAMLTSVSQAANFGYDAQVDPFAQYRQATSKAAETNKLVLIIAGGDWCRWCYVLNRFVAANDDVEQRLNDTFVVMKVYVGPDNYNELFFSQLPQAYGAPHFWIVSPDDSKVLASQSTAKLERGSSTYDKALFLAFIDQWRRPLADLQRQALAAELVSGTLK